MAEVEANNKILALILASLNRKDDLKDKLWYLPNGIFNRLKSIQQKSLDKSEQIKNDEEQKEKAIKEYVKDTGNYSDMFCVGDDADKNCIIEEKEEEDEEDEDDEDDLFYTNQ
jgi:hypothetical protein